MTSSKQTKTTQLPCHDSAQGTLFADYGRMLFFVSAVFFGLFIAVSSQNDKLRLIGCFTAAWIATRVYLLRWRWYMPFITAGLFTAVLLLPSEANSTSSLLSERSMTFRGVFALLLMVGLADVNTISKRISNIVHTEEQATALRKWLLRYGKQFLKWTLLTVLLTYSFIVPLIQEFMVQQQGAPENPLQKMDRLALPMNILLRFSESMTALFAFMIGACVGSFLNVVIYRVPQKASVLIEPSYCPGCKTKIIPRDNLPLLGWLNLKGQCRQCQIPIPMRYPAVELTVGLALLTLYFVELISGGVNLPARTPNPYAGVLWILFYTKWDLVGFYLYHSALLCTVFSWGMISFDGHRVPRFTVMISLAVFAALQFCFPGLQLLNGLQPGTKGLITTAMLVATTCGLGLTSGLCAGWITGKLTGVFGTKPALNCIPAWLLIGLALGWQAVAGIFVLLHIWQFMTHIHRAFLDPNSDYTLRLKRLDLALSAFLLLHHCVWRSIWNAIAGST